MRLLAKPRRIARVAARAVRRRRTPEVARTEILDAAERVFRRSPPDRVGLKEIGREAGVSHALVTHYFGSYDGVVEAVFERRSFALRDAILERLEAGHATEIAQLVELLFATFDDPVHVRLMKWLVATESRSSEHALALRDHGLRIVAEHAATALDPNPSAELRARVGLAVVATVAAAFGYSAAKKSLANGVGRPAAELDRGVRAFLAEMLEAYFKPPQR